MCSLSLWGTLIREASKIRQGVQRQGCGRRPWDTGVGGGTEKGCEGHIVRTPLLLQETVLHSGKKEMKQLVQSFNHVSWDKNRMGRE